MLTTITDNEFKRFQSLIHEIAGIHLPPSKKALVCGRLAKRLQARDARNFDAYYRLITDRQEAAELQIAVDLLTTNETYFFREPKHFSYVADHILPRVDKGRLFRAWSAASSSGEEAYSISMVLDDHLGAEGRWEVFGSDLSGRVLEKARVATYPTTRLDGIPKDYLRRYCLRGVGSQEGRLRIRPELRGRVRFAQLNLTGPLQSAGEFDIIFLRNVLIYFDAQTKRQVVERVVRQLKPGGWLFIGHSETLNGICPWLTPEQPTVYRKK